MQICKVITVVHEKGGIDPNLCIYGIAMMMMIKRTNHARQTIRDVSAVTGGSSMCMVARFRMRCASLRCRGMRRAGLHMTRTKR